MQAAGAAAAEAVTATPARAQVLAENLRAVMSRIDAAAPTDSSVRLVAVSKLKPASDILSLYTETGQRHMGENYVQELLEKAPQLPRDIDWHFIGQLQTNKCRRLAEEIPNLWAVESVDRAKKADALEKGRAVLAASATSHGSGGSNGSGSSSTRPPKLRVYVQVNTSGEESKSGCAPSDALAIARHIQDSCPHLALQGLMTIGSIERSRAADQDENQDFVLLRDTARAVEKELGIELELSMGMSSDYEQAIRLGARSVRVGTAIFGERPPKAEGKG